MGYMEWKLYPEGVRGVALCLGDRLVGRLGLGGSLLGGQVAHQTRGWCGGVRKVKGIGYLCHVLCWWSYKSDIVDDLGQYCIIVSLHCRATPVFWSSNS